MLKNIKRRFDVTKVSKLKVTPGENVRDAILKTGLKSVEEIAYQAGNNTDTIAKLAKTAGALVDRGTELGVGGEAATSLARIAFKGMQDSVVRKDPLCTGLCVVSGASEALAVCCSTIQIIPFRGRIYVYAKLVSKSCMTFRNLCAADPSAVGC